MMADQNEKGSSQKHGEFSSGTHATTSTASTDGPSVRINKLEIGGRGNPFIADLVNSEVNFRPPTNSAQSGNATSKPQSYATPDGAFSGMSFVEIDEFHNTGTENPVIGRVVNTKLNFYDDPDDDPDNTAPKVEKDPEDQSTTTRRDVEIASGGEGRGWRPIPTLSGGPQININKIKITGEGNPVIANAKGSTFNM